MFPFDAQRYLEGLFVCFYVLRTSNTARRVSSQAREQASKRTPLKSEMEKLRNEMVRSETKDEEKNEWFKVPVNVKQINEYLFSDIVQS